MPTAQSIADPEFWTAFGTTLLLGGGMTVIAVPLGAGLAFLMARTDVPGRAWLEPVILIPIFVSAVVIAFGYVVALGPVGFLTIAVRSLIGFELVLSYSTPLMTWPRRSQRRI